VYKATFGSSFDYSILQFGDSLRFGTFGDTSVAVDSSAKYHKVQVNTFEKSSASDVNLIGLSQSLGVIARTRATDYRPLPSMGQVRLALDFEPGGTETITYTSKAGKAVTVPNVPYLNIRVRNIASYTREVIDENGNKKEDSVTYNYEFPPDPASSSIRDSSTTTLTYPYRVALGDYVLYAYGWEDRPTDLAGRSKPIGRTKLSISTSPIGTPNRYYLSIPANRSEDGLDSLFFTHRLIVNGAEILLDAAGMGSTDANVDLVNLPANVPTSDFKAGDRVIVNFTGGALGLPSPGAKILVAISDPKPKLIDSANGRDFTDDLLDQITIVPNPYLIDHLGQVSNSDHKLYFTRLPSKCTIEIYTAAGELLKTIDHEASIENGRVAVEAWDLLTKAERQTQSQLLIARITTPNGAETIKKFAVIVGGFRLFNR
jgi:hypothetical protein